METTVGVSHRSDTAFKFIMSTNEKNYGSSANTDTEVKCLRMAIGDSFQTSVQAKHPMKYSNETFFLALSRIPSDREERNSAVVEYLFYSFCSRMSSSFPLKYIAIILVSYPRGHFAALF